MRGFTAPTCLVIAPRPPKLFGGRAREMTFDIITIFRILTLGTRLRETGTQGKNFYIAFVKFLVVLKSSSFASKESSKWHPEGASIRRCCT